MPMTSFPLTGWITMLLLTFAMVGCNQVSDANPTPIKPTANNADTSKSEKPKEEKKQDKTEVKDDKKSEAKPQRATAVFAGGCFWCVEAVFEELEGVIEAVSGYAGGTKETANYEAVCTGKTAHAEVVQISYDPTKITFEKLLAVHFATHDPTTLNRQGHDIGPQYRSAIFYASEDEKKTTEEMIARLTEAKAFPRKIVTTLEPLKEFFVAEKYHQNYVCDNPLNGYVRGVALPKVEKVREKFKEDLKKK